MTIVYGLRHWMIDNRHSEPMLSEKEQKLVSKKIPEKMS